jgi:Domain of unknown function (DUF397)
MMRELEKLVTDFRKSTYSGAANPNCVEVAFVVAEVVVRDSKDPAGPTLTFTPEEWAAFLVGVNQGEFGLI